MILIENTFDNIKYKFRAQRKLDEKNKQQINDELMHI